MNELPRTLPGAVPGTTRPCRSGSIAVIAGLCDYPRLFRRFVAVTGGLNMPHWTALVTVLAILLYFYTGTRVSAARRKFGVPVPAISGNPDFERVFRVQANTLEWMPIFLPLLWLFAYYVSDIW